MKELKVADNYRTNALSLKPGGYVVKVSHADGKVFVYDKVKKPGAYLKMIKDQNPSHGEIIQISVNDSVVWSAGCGKNFWEI
jgi:hypothetical protein